MFAVNVSPDMAMYKLLKSQGYETSYALAEFIDNSIHAWQQIKASENLEVTIKFYSMEYSDAKKRNSIEIIDNGPGIARNQIADAFKPAKAPAEKGLSEFGIGMKTAAVWFADEWFILTKPVKDKSKYRFKFDLNELLNSGSDSVGVAESKKNLADHGTTIFLHSLRRPINLIKYKEICKDLCEMYQKFTSGKNKILVLSAEYDDTPCTLNFVPPTRPVLKAPIHKNIKSQLYAIGSVREWREDISFNYKGCHVTGFIQILETGSYKFNPGLVLFRYNRVIMGLTRTPYIPESLFGTANKYSKQRIYGELHLDGLPVSYNKDKFEFDEDEFISLIKGKSEVAQLLKQSSDYRTNATCIEIKSEDDLKDPQKTSEGGNEKNGKDSNSNTESNGANSTSKSKNSNSNNSNQQITPTAIQVLNTLKTSIFNLSDIIQETITQYQADHPISTALCLRIIVEVGVLSKIERDKKSEYSKVSHMAIASLLKYINTNNASFFSAEDHQVKKCVQSLASGTQADIILLNNISHGHYHPTIDELTKLIKNIQPLLEWAYSVSLQTN